MKRGTFLELEKRVFIRPLGCRTNHDVTHQCGGECRVNACRETGILLESDLTLDSRTAVKQQLVVRTSNRYSGRIEGLDGVIALNRGTALKIQRVDKTIAGHVPDRAVGNAEHKAFGVFA